MHFFKAYIILTLLFIFLASCISHQHVQSNLPSPGKQCKILLNKKYAKIKKRKRVNNPARQDKFSEPDQKNLQAKLMTQEEYLQEVEKFKKTLPEFDVENDCPPALKKHKKKKFKIKSIFKK